VNEPELLVHFLVDTDREKITNIFKLILTNCSKIEEIRINADDNEQLRKIKEDLKEDLKEEIKNSSNIKKIVFIRYFDESEILNII
jgi:NRPS condensation-like uncharacterized protein